MDLNVLQSTEDHTRCEPRQTGSELVKECNTVVCCGCKMNASVNMSGRSEAPRLISTVKQSAAGKTGVTLTIGGQECWREHICSDSIRGQLL